MIPLAVFSPRALRATEILADTFTGASLDTGEWTATTYDTSTVTQDDELICTIPAAKWYARVKSSTTIPTTNLVEIEFDWTPGTVYYGATARPYVAVIPASPTREATYTFPDGYPVCRLGDSLDTTSRTKLYVGTSNSYGITGTYAEGTWDASTKYAIKWQIDWQSSKMSLWVDSVQTITNQAFTYTPSGDHFIELANCDYGGESGIEKFDNLVVTHIT